MNPWLTSGRSPLLVTTAMGCALLLTGCAHPGPSGSGASHPTGAPTTGAATGSAGTTSTRTLPALDGVYVADVTPAELLSHGSPDALDENFGHFVWVFDNGINVQGQESPHACTWSVHSVTDHRNGLFTVSTLAAGGIAPNNGNAKVGEPDGTLRWTLYRGILTLQPTSPERFWIKPFRQVSRTPTLTWFSHRCPPPAGALKPG
jgi:hypothetical protein